jgi:hypothetical protein
MILAMKRAPCVHLLRIVLLGVPFSPHDILQPPEQVLQVNRRKISIVLQLTEYVIASFIEVASS